MPYDNLSGWKTYRKLRDTGFYKNPGTGYEKRYNERLESPEKSAFSYPSGSLGPAIDYCFSEHTSKEMLKAVVSPRNPFRNVDNSETSLVHI